MCRIAFYWSYFIEVYPDDKNENRRHIHVRKNKLLAKIWIEKHGIKDFEIQDSF